MKNSKIPWIGDIPNHWTLCSTSALFHEHKEKNKGLTCTNLLSLSYGRIRRKDINTTEGLLPESFDTYNIISSGDIVFRLTDLQNDHKSLRTALCTEQGIITSAYLTLRKNACINERYYHYLFHIYDVCKVFYGMGDGVRQGMGWNDIKSMPLFMAPYEEQQRIADFLDRKCADINNVLEKTKASIEEYKKLKQLVITEAVAKGIKGDRPMIESGVELIGRIPAEWRIAKIKTLVKVSDGTHDTPQYVDKSNLSYPLVTSKCIVSGTVNLSLANHISQKDYWEINKRSKVSKYDVLMPMIGTVGNPAIVLDEPNFAIKNVALLKTSGNIYSAKFIFYLINSSLIINQFELLNRGGVQNFISQDKLRNLYITLPPQPEIKEIVTYLDQKCSEIDSLVESKEKFVKELELYKQSLIYEYVTGKKAVC